MLNKAVIWVAWVVGVTAICVTADDFPEGYFALCTVAKDQHKDIREWVEYNRHIGVRRIYLYDHRSSVPMRDLLSDFLQSGLVQYNYFNPANNTRIPGQFASTDQYAAYQDCFTKHRKQHRFIGFLDVDEFVVFHDSFVENVDTLLKAYEPYGGLALNWVMFGGGGHIRRPIGGALVNYVHCLPLNHTDHNQVKVIANTAHALGIGMDPHHLAYPKGSRYYTVNEMFQPVTSSRTKTPSHVRVALYHYVIKSREDYGAKVERGSAAGNHKKLEFETAMNNLATAVCTRGAELGYRCCPSVLAEIAGEGIPGIADVVVPWQILRWANMTA